MGFPGALAPKESPFFIKVKCLYVLRRRKEKECDFIGYAAEFAEFD